MLQMSPQIADYSAKQQFDLPYYETAEFSTVVSEYQDLYSANPGYTPHWRIIIFLPEVLLSVYLPEECQLITELR